MVAIDEFRPGPQEATGASPSGSSVAGPVDDGPPHRPDLSRLLAPRSVVVVGATDRPGSGAAQTLLNLRRAGFTGKLAGVHPRHERILDVPCRPDLAAALEVIGGPADAVVVATTTATVPDYLSEAGRLGCGGAVVFTGGFADAGDLAAQERLVAAAGQHRLPVLGPNSGGLVSARDRAPLWSEPVTLPALGDGSAEADDGIVLITESTDTGLLILAHRRADGLHTVVCTGGAALTDTPDLLAALARAEGVRSIALYLERIPDGGRLAAALADCARADVRPVVLRSGRHRRPDPALDALLDEAGAVLCRDVHQLVETARALARGRRSRRPAAVLTSCFADADLAADLAADAGTRLAELSPGTRADLAAQLPRDTVPGNPLDHTTGLWAQTAALAAITATVAADPQVGTVLYVQDEPAGLHPQDTADWADTRAGVEQGAARHDTGFLLVSGMPGQEPAGAVSGLPAALAALTALQCPAPGPERLLGISDAALRTRAARTTLPATGPNETGLDETGPNETGLDETGPNETGLDGKNRTGTTRATMKQAGTQRLRTNRAGTNQAREQLAEHVVKAELNRAGVAVLRHAVVPVPQDDRDPSTTAAAVAMAAAQIGFPVTLRLSQPGAPQTAGSPVLADEDRVAGKVAGLLARTSGLDRLTLCASALLVEALPLPGVTLTITVHHAGALPALTVGLGGAWAQVVTATRTVLLPAAPDRIARAVAGLPGTATADLEGAGQVGVRLTQLFTDGGFTRIGADVIGRTVVRAQACRV